MTCGRLCLELCSWFKFIKSSKVFNNRVQEETPKLSDQQRVMFVKQSRLSHATVCLLLREPRIEGKQARCHSTKVSEVLEKTNSNKVLKDFSMHARATAEVIGPVITVFFI